MKTKKNALEWIVFAVSAVLIAGVVSVLVIAGVRSGQTPPSLRIETGAAEASEGSFRVPVRVRNMGEETAEQALIEVQLIANGTAVERAELLIPFVPKRSSREGWVVFARDPRCCTLATRAVAFNKP
jgi:uncharacterized protein (TIGR02588 family)